MVDPESIGFSQHVPVRLQEELISQISELAEPCGYLFIESVVKFPSWYIVHASSYESLTAKCEGKESLGRTLLRVYPHQKS